MPASFYVSYWKDAPAAMTVTNVNAWVDGTHIASYGPLEDAIESELKDGDDKITFIGMNLTDVAIGMVQGLMTSGIPREDELGLCLTKFIAPQTITFRGILSNEASKGDAILLLDEEPIHKKLNSENIDALFNLKFKGATYKGLCDIINGIESSDAITTSEILYNTIDQQFSKDANGNPRKVSITKEYSFLATIKVNVKFKGLLDGLFKNAAELRAFLPKLKLSITIGTYPYSAKDSDYGTKGAAKTPSAPYNPLIFWGLDAYGE